MNAVNTIFLAAGGTVTRGETMPWTGHGAPSPTKTPGNPACHLWEIVALTQQFPLLDKTVLSRNDRREGMTTMNVASSCSCYHCPRSLTPSTPTRYFPPFRCNCFAGRAARIFWRTSVPWDVLMAADSISTIADDRCAAQAP